MKTRYFIYFLLLLGACAKDNLPTTGSIEGRVIDVIDSKPISNATINLRSNVGNLNTNSTSNASGVFTFPDVLVGEYSLSATASGYSISPSETVTVEGGRKNKLTLVMSALKARLEVNPQRADFRNPNEVYSLVLESKENTAIDWQVINTTDWLKIDPNPPNGKISPPTNRATITLSIDKTKIANLLPKKHETTISINSNGGSYTIPVSLLIEEVLPELSVDKRAINFDNAFTQSLTISNKGQGILEWSVIENIEWLKINPMSGKGNTSLALMAFPQGLKAGKYTDSFVIVSNGGSQIIEVSLTVKDPTIPNSPYLKVSNVFLPITTTQSANLTIQNEGQGDLYWSVLAQVPWLNVSQLSGKGNSTLTFSYNNSPLPAGTYSHIVTIQSNGGTANVLVSLQIGSNPIVGLPNNEGFLINTQFASNLLENSATLNGKINTKGVESTISFEYGTTTNLGNEIPALPTLIRNNGENTVLANLTTLEANTTYYFRLKVQNVQGIFYGNIVTFRTPAPNLSKFDRDLFVYFPFDNTINDYTKNFKTSMKNASTGGNGREIYVDGLNGKGKALDFSGDYSYVEFDKCKDVGNVFTFSFFVKTSVEDRKRGNGTYRNVFSITRGDWKTFEISITSGDNNGLGQPLLYSTTLKRAWVNQGDITLYIYGGKPVDDNQFRHIVMTGDGKTLRFYVDGVPYNAEEYSCNYTIGNGVPGNGVCVACIESNYKMTIGSSLFYGSPFVGAIDEFRIYQRAFSAEEVVELFRSYQK